MCEQSINERIIFVVMAHIEQMGAYLSYQRSSSFWSVCEPRNLIATSDSLAHNEVV